MPVAPVRPEGTDPLDARTVLATGEDTWIPAIVAYYGLRDATPAEMFWYRISTGYAVHTDSAEVLVCGICEVIERDAVAVT